MNRSIIIIVAVLLTSCGSKNHFKLPKSDLKVSLRQESQFNIACAVPIDSPEFKSIQNWLTTNQSDWHKSPGSYLPNKVITGTGFKAQILLNSIVINDLWVHGIDNVFYESIRCK